MIHRALKNTIESVSRTFPILMITGPRQVGKTTLLEMCRESDRGYVTLDDWSLRDMARTDPGYFISMYPPPLIIDEVQYAPELFSYLKIVADQSKANGLYWLTGSQKFHLMQGVSESLAGRVGLVNMLGLSTSEIEGRSNHSEPFVPTAEWFSSKMGSASPLSIRGVFERIWLGSFPKLYHDPDISRDVFYQSYLETYVSRDIKSMIALVDESAFVRFLVGVAARTGTLLNIASLARDAGIDHKTANQWVGILERAGIVYLLQPYFNNRLKRLVKTPKIYFLDTGLASYLCKWPTSSSLEAGMMSSQILETFVFVEILKSYWYKGLTPHLYFYRDTDQQEVDLVIETGDTLYPIEIKKTATPSGAMSKNFHVLKKLGKNIGHGAVICCVQQITPLSKDVTAVPVGLL